MNITQLSPGVRVAAVCVIIAILIMVAYKIISREGFATRQEKVHAIMQWFARHPINPKYADYRNDVPGSNIVEFEQVRVSDKTINAINKIV